MQATGGKIGLAIAFFRAMGKNIATQERSSGDSS